MQDLGTSPSLLLRLSEGVDPAAWHEFERRYSGLIRRVLAERGVQPADRDDITQEVLLSLVKVMPGFEYDPARGRFRSHLKTVVVRALARRHRRKARPLELGLEVEAAPPIDDELEAIWERQWRHYHMRRALARVEAEFTQLDRAIFEAYGVEGRPARVVAESCGVGVDRVYRVKSVMLARLSELIEEQVAEEG